MYLLSTLTCLWEFLMFWLSGAQEDSGGLRHGPGLPAVSGPAGIHARAHLPWRERSGLLPGSPGGGSAQHDQRVGLILLVCAEQEHYFLHETEKDYKITRMQGKFINHPFSLMKCTVDVNEGKSHSGLLIYLLHSSQCGGAVAASNLCFTSKSKSHSWTF